MAARLTAYIVAIIVGITFIAGLIVGAQREDNGPVDVMVVNGHVYTADGKGTEAQAVAIQGNKILRVGTTREIQRLRRPQTVVIDAKGGAVVPGFIDSDVRLIERAPTGGPAIAPVIGPVLTPTRDEELSTLRVAALDAHRKGITSIQTTGGTPYDLELFDELRREGTLALRVYGALAIPATMTGADLDALDELRARFSDDPFFKAGVAQLVVESDANEPFTPERLSRLVTELDRRNWQVLIQAKGDRAIAMALAAYKHAIDANPVPARGRRHRIEADTFGPIDFAPFEAIGVVHSPATDTVTVGAAIDAYTRQAAWASFDEQRKGMLARDMLADVVVLSRDIFAQPSARLTDADVSVTIFDGKVVFQKGVDTEY